MASLGFGSDLSITQCTASLPMPNGVPGGVLESVTAVQMTLGWASSTVAPFRPLPAMATGIANVAEACIRRLTTPQGTLPDVVTPPTTGYYGNDLTAYVNEDIDARQLGLIAASVDAELRKDERIQKVTTNASMVGNLLMIAIAVVTAQGPFKLVLAVSDVTTTLLTTPQ